MIALLKTQIQEKDAAKIIQLIVEKPEILDLADKNGSSGFMLIAYSGLDEAFEKAIESKKSFTFHEAIVAGNLEVVKHYLEVNPELANTYANDGFTPLSLASFFNQTSIAKLLLEKDADPSIPATNPSKVNALHSAIAKENYALCQLFLVAGVKVNATQMQGVTALHSAVHRGNLQLTQLLVENGANIALEMDNGDTALMIAQKEGHSEVEAYLLKITNTAK